MQNSEQSVDDLMTRFPLFVTANQTVAEARRLCRNNRIHYLLIADQEGDLCGLTCRCHLRRGNPTSSVMEVAQRPVVFVNTGEPASRAACIMERCCIGCLPVIGKRGVVLGIVTRHDFRDAGVLEGEMGLRRCAWCGTSHDLHQSRHLDDLMICNACLSYGTKELRPAEALRDSRPSWDPSEPVTWV